MSIMQNTMKRLSIHTVVALILLSIGCAPYQSILKADLPTDVAETLLDQWNGLFPGECMLTQRIVLKLGGKVYDFSGAAAIRRPDKFRIMAFGDMGGLLFDFLLSDSVRIVKKMPRGMPEGPIYRGVLQDIQFLYGLHTGIVSAARLDSGLTACRLTDGEIMHTCIFDSAFLPLTANSVRGRRRIRTVDFLEFGQVQGDPSPLPVRMVLVNHQYRYRMEVSTSRVQTVIKSDTVFQ
jgi:hypothetical protein